MVALITKNDENKKTSTQKWAESWQQNCCQERSGISKVISRHGYEIEY